MPVITEVEDKTRANGHTHHNESSLLIITIRAAHSIGVFVVFQLGTASRTD